MYLDEIDSSMAHLVKAMFRKNNFIFSKEANRLVKRNFWFFQGLAKIVVNRLWYVQLNKAGFVIICQEIHVKDTVFCSI